MENSLTQDGIATLLSNPSSSFQPLVQVVDLTPGRVRYKFDANDGKMKLKSMLPETAKSDIISGKIQNLGLIRLLDYDVKNLPQRYLLVMKYEIVVSALDSEIKTESKGFTGITLKPKQDFVSNFVSELINEQMGNADPVARMAMTRRVHPLGSLNSNQGNWTIKVRVTHIWSLRNYSNFKGKGCVFSVELTDEKETKIQATMFNAVAKKFCDIFQMGKVYYISGGSLKPANKQFNVLANDHEIILNENSKVEEASDEEVCIPETKFNFVPIDELGTYVNKPKVIDVIGVVVSVSPTMSIKRNNGNEVIPKREITLADEAKKTVVVSLWRDLAIGIGQELLDVADNHPVIAIKSVKVGDFQGVSLSTISRSNVVINPDLPEAAKLKTWYDSEGRETTMSAIGYGMSSSANKESRSMYSDRASLSYIIRNPSLGEDKPVLLNTRAYISCINPKETKWYRACKTCNKKVKDAMESGYWCVGCQKKYQEYILRYIIKMKVSDSTGEALFHTFNDEAEKIIGCTAEELNKLKTEDEDEFETKLKEAAWSSYIFWISVSQEEYNNKKSQRITVKRVSPTDFDAEEKLLS